MDIQKKIGKTMSIYMGVTMSIILSALGLIIAGRFSLISYISSLVIALIVSLLLGFIVPIKTISDKVLEFLKISEGTLKAKLVSSFVSDIIYTPLICLACMSFSVLMAGKSIDAQIVEKTTELQELTSQLEQVNNEITKVEDEMVVNIDKLAQFGISSIDAIEETNLNPTASEIVAEIEAEQQELKAKANQLEEMNTGIKQLNGVISSMQSSKPRLMTLWLNQCWLNVLVGWIVIYFIQPFYLKKVMKKYNIIQ